MTLKKTAKNLSITIASIILTLVFLEIILRIFYPPVNIEQLPRGLHREDAVLGTRMNENFQGAHKQEEFAVLIKTNSDGIRDKEYAQKDDSTLRILCLGDSFTFGFGVELDNSFSKQLEVLLNNYSNENNIGKKIEVINAGHVGWGTVDEYNFLRHIGFKYSPDLVLVVFFIGNDLWDNLNSFQRIKKTELKTPASALSPFRDFLQRHLRLYDFLFKKVMRRPQISKMLLSMGLRRIQAQLYEPHSSFIYTDSMEVTKNTLLEIKKDLGSKNIKMILAILPEDTQIFFFDVIKSKGLLPTKVQGELINFCKSNNIYVIDLLPYMANEQISSKLYFKKDSHINTFGHQFVAELLYEYIIKKEVLF